MTGNMARGGVRFNVLPMAGAILLLALGLFGAVDEAQATLASTTTTVAGSPNPSSQGQLVTFIATVMNTANFGGAPTGSVTFKDSATTLGTVSLTSSGAKTSTASFSTAALTAASHTISASYTPSGFFSASSGTTTQVVNAAPTVAPQAGPTDSQKLHSLQISGSQFVSTTSGQAITGAVQGGISDAFSNGTNPIIGGANGLFFSSSFAAEPPPESSGPFGALAYAKAPPPRPAEREWNVWADLRGTNWDRTDNTGDLRGDQLNFNAGVGRKLSPNLVVGLLTGFENFRYDSATLNGTVKGTGGTIGGYAAWRPASALQFDATLAWSDINYNAASGAASGSFTGSRWLASGGVSDTFALGRGLVFEPSAQLYALWESQGAYTDSAGTLQASRDFSVGRASTGGKFAYTSITAGDTKITPFAGLYTDYRFSNGVVGDAQPIGAPILSVVDGWSARVSTGLTVSTSNGAKVNFISEFGGIGSGSYNVWSGQVRGSVPF
jgi:hypothetical protein